MENMKSKITSSFLWRFAERCGAQGVTFIVSIILARILDPEIYGVVALVTVFSGILEVFVDSGFGNALIQKKDADNLDFSTVFFFNIFICVLLYLLMFGISPIIARFYDRPQLTSVIRVASITILISGVKNVQIAYVSRNMLFKRFFFATLGGTVGAAVIGIYMAYNGYGVWALVLQSLFNQIVDTIILWITVKWKPQRTFSVERLKILFSYGWKLLVASLLDAGYNKLRDLIIGKKYTANSLAYYSKGFAFPNTIALNINSSVDSVLLPTMSKMQDDYIALKAVTRRSIKICTFLMMPLMMGLAVCAEPIVRIVLTEKWIPCVPFLRVFCFTCSFWPVHTANTNAVKALGRSELYLKLEIIKKLIGLTAVLISMWFGVMAMAYSLLITCIIYLVIYSFPNKVLLGYSFFEQIKDIIPPIIISCVMGVIVYCITYLELNDWLTLIIQIPLGVLIYIGFSAIFKIDSYSYMKGIISGLLSRKKS